MTRQENFIGIDVENAHKAVMIRALSRLKSTVCVADGGKYHSDASLGVVRLTTTLTEEQVGEWACRVKAGRGYIGTFQLL